jgi:two-component system KDP operon response regulator KdpE
MKILVIQSDPLLRSVMEMALARAGYEVTGADGMEPALSLAEKEKPGLVLLDLFLNDGVGLENIRRIQARSASPVMVITRLGFKETVEQALSSGASDFMIKPFDAAYLVERVNLLLSRLH